MLTLIHTRYTIDTTATLSKVAPPPPPPLPLLPLLLLYGSVRLLLFGCAQQFCCVTSTEHSLCFFSRLFVCDSVFSHAHAMLPPSSILPIPINRIIFQAEHCITPCTTQLLTNIDLLRGPERPPSFSLSTLTLRHSPVRTAERARMRETAHLSAFVYFFQNSC